MQFAAKTIFFFIFLFCSDLLCSVLSRAHLVLHFAFMCSIIIVHRRHHCASKHREEIINLLIIREELLNSLIIICDDCEKFLMFEIKMNGLILRKN